MTHIVTTTYRYKRPPKKRKAVALDAPRRWQWLTPRRIGRGLHSQ